MTQQEFAETIKVAPATLSSIFTGRTAPSLKIVDAIKTRFPDISTDWLLFGRGAMTDDKASEAESAFVHPSSPDGGGVLDFGKSSQSVSASGSDNVLAKLAGHDVDASGGRSTILSSVGVQSDKRVRSVKAGVDDVHVVKNIDIRERHIVEIRIFYDDQTWETFVPKK